jgi:hypothetical protein
LLADGLGCAALAPLARLRGAPACGRGAAGRPERRNVAALPKVRQVPPRVELQGASMPAARRVAARR